VCVPPPKNLRSADMERKPFPSAKVQTLGSSTSPEDKAGGSVKLVHAVGMHARPAVKLTKLAKRFRSRIVVRVVGAEEWIDAKSVAKVMAMRAPCDSTIEFVATGADARAAVRALTTLVANDFPDNDG
jgi:phosphocarrier protein HPr